METSPGKRHSSRPSALSKEQQEPNIPAELASPQLSFIGARQTKPLSTTPKLAAAKTVSLPSVLDQVEHALNLTSKAMPEPSSPQISQTPGKQGPETGEGQGSAMSYKQGSLHAVSASPAGSMHGNLATSEEDQGSPSEYLSCGSPFDGEGAGARSVSSSAKGGREFCFGSPRSTYKGSPLKGSPLKGSPKGSRSPRAMAPLSPRKGSDIASSPFLKDSKPGSLSGAHQAKAAFPRQNQEQSRHPQSPCRAQQARTKEQAKGQVEEHCGGGVELDAAAVEKLPPLRHSRDVKGSLAASRQQKAGSNRVSPSRTAIKAAAAGKGGTHLRGRRPGSASISPSRKRSAASPQISPAEGRPTWGVSRPSVARPRGLSPLKKFNKVSPMLPTADDPASGTPARVPEKATKSRLESRTSRAAPRPRTPVLKSQAEKGGTEVSPRMRSPRQTPAGKEANGLPPPASETIIGAGLTPVLKALNVPLKTISTPESTHTGQLNHAVSRLDPKHRARQFEAFACHP